MPMSGRLHLPSSGKTTLPNARPRLNLPRVRSLVLTDFSLYSAEPTIDVEFDKGVFCLAGANGLGKSTFLAAVNFALTGRVSEPDRTFLSIGEYYSHTREFSAAFFEGRIDEDDRESAEAKLEMTVGKATYRITRGMFEPDELRHLEIIDEDGVELGKPKHPNPRELHDIYCQHIAMDIGLHSFEQFVFLQHFVFTFDERRHLLFWDEKVLERALYIAFGVDQKDAERADELRRESEKADSLARNANWQATELRKKLEELQKAIGGKVADEDPSDLRAEHEKLVEATDEMDKRAQAAENALKDTNLKISDLSARQASLRAEYEVEFSKRFQTQSAVEQSPIVAMSLAGNKCEVCGTEGSTVSGVIRKKLTRHQCPMCEQPIKPAKAKDLKSIQALDLQISDIRASLSDTVKLRDRLQKELTAALERAGDARRAVSKFEEANGEALASFMRSTKVDSVQATIKRYRSQVQELLEKKEAHYDRRNHRRKELAILQKGLIDRYDQAEAEFVPSFTNLAYSFIGLDLDIRIETTQNVGVAILLEVKSSARRQFHQLSESQRFFIDMALRMAMIKYMSASDSKGSFYVDTPEGSLDIAYESRAGDMFAKFVRDGFGVIMTANINTSRLLLSLAEKCGKQLMNLCRMTTWTELSDVQQAEEHLFDQAFKSIEEAMAKSKVPERVVLKPRGRGIKNG